MGPKVARPPESSAPAASAGAACLPPPRFDSQLSAVIYGSSNYGSVLRSGPWSSETSSSRLRVHQGDAKCLFCALSGRLKSISDLNLPLDVGPGDYEAATGGVVRCGQRMSFAAQSPRSSLD